MAKNLNKLNGLNKKSPTAIRTSDQSAEEEKKVGRPKNGETKAISLRVPVEMSEKMEYAKLMYGGNLNAYINAVIAKDLEDHAAEYAVFQEMTGKNTF